MTGEGKRWFDFSKVKYVESQEMALDLIEQYEIQTSTKFSVYKGKSLKNFGKTDWKRASSRIFWEENYHTKFEPLEGDGIPYMSFGKVVLDCHHGKDRRGSTGALKNNNRTVKKRAPQYSKIGCRAQIRLREIIKFPQYQIMGVHSTDVERKYEKRKLSKALCKALTEGKDVIAERRIYIYFPKKEEHDHDPFDHEKPGYHLPIDQRIISLIYEKVAEGVTRPFEMRRHIEKYVKYKLFHPEAGMVPSSTNRRFLPTISDVKNHIALAKAKLLSSNLDEDNIIKFLSKWKDVASEEMKNISSDNSGDNFFFRSSSGLFDNFIDTDPYKHKLTRVANTTLSENIPNSGVLFVHQTAWQRYLLEKYGNELFLLEAVYRPREYTLFFVVVCTNVDYQVVCTFVVEKETQETLEAALKILREWNPGWCPRHAMIEYDDEKIRATEAVFADCSVLFCDYHREQSWQCWMRKTSGGISDRNTAILNRLKKLAEAETEEEYEVELEQLKISREWKCMESIKFKKWIEEGWLPEHKRWVNAYRKDHLLPNVHFNRGLSLNPTFKPGLAKHLIKTNSLSQLIQHITKTFLPNLFMESYIAKNNSFSSLHRSYPPDVPSYLYNRPGHFVHHCYERLLLAQQLKQSYKTGDILEKNAMFVVSCQLSDDMCYHNVYFGHENGTWPSCSCSDWIKYKIPCVHFFTVMSLPQCGMSWKDLPAWYRESSFFTLDTSVSMNVIPSNDNNDHVTHIINDCSKVDEKENVINLSPAFHLIANSDLSKCHNLLQQICSKLFIVVDLAEVSAVANELQCILDRLNASIEKTSSTEVHSRGEKQMLSEKKQLTTTSPLTDNYIDHSILKKCLSDVYRLETEINKSDMNSIKVEPGDSDIDFQEREAFDATSRILRRGCKYTLSERAAESRKCLSKNYFTKLKNFNSLQSLEKENFSSKRKLAKSCDGLSSFKKKQTEEFRECERVVNASIKENRDFVHSCFGSIDQKIIVLEESSLNT